MKGSGNEKMTPDGSTYPLLGEVGMLKRTYHSIFALPSHPSFSHGGDEVSF